MFSRLLLVVAWIQHTTGFILSQNVGKGLVYQAKPLAAPAPLVYTNNIVELSRVKDNSPNAAIHQAIRRGASTERISSRLQSGNISLVAAEGGSLFLAKISVGTPSQALEVVVDTGSSDTWFPLANFTCLDPTTSDVLPQKDCLFPKFYKTTSSSLQIIPDTNFNISYQDGEYVNGVMIYESLSVAGISITHQEMALATEAAWYGDGQSSGLMGFAYPILTNAYPGTNATQDDPDDYEPYNPPFTSMYEENKTSSMFSLALNRQPFDAPPNSVSGGYLAIGGIPNIPHDSTFVSTSIDVATVVADNVSIYEYYSITVGGYGVSNNKNVQFNTANVKSTSKTSVMAKNTSAIVDSGTTLLYVPDEVAIAFADAFDPPGEYDEYSGFVFVACNATVPLFGVDIAGKMFFVNPLDLVLQESETLCVSGVQPNGGGYSVLGDVFLRNVLAVFDVGAGQMQFSAREYSALH